MTARVEPPASPDEPWDDDPRDWDEEDGGVDCEMMPDGQCLLAGSEWCARDCGRLG